MDGAAELVAHPQPAVPTVAELTGRPGLRFAEWARRHRPLFENA